MSRMSTAASLALFAAAVTMVPACPGWAGGLEGMAAGAARGDANASGATDRMIVKYRGTAMLSRSAAAAPVPSDRMSVLQGLAARHGAGLKHLRNTAQGAHVLQLNRRLGAQEAAALAAALKAKDPDIEYVEPDRILHALMMPNDGQYTSQWNLYDATAGIRAPQAWDLSTGAGVTVAVLDTGYRPHADLAANIVAGYDFVNNAVVANDGNVRDSDAKDPGDWVTPSEAGEPGGMFENCEVSDSSWHGTHVAGTIAGLTNNSNGIAGIAFGAKVQPARVLGKCGGYTSDIADAIVWTSGGSVSGVPANATPARVINLSLGGRGACGITTQNAIDSARAHGAVVVVAAGNSGADAGDFAPASCAGVVTVAATNRSGSRAFYSNYGSQVTLAAPGGDMRSTAADGILSTLNSGLTTPGSDSYAFYQGTSMATPHVSAVAALMIAKKPTATVDQVISALKTSARAFPGSCSGCGSGLLDAYAAVQAITGTGGSDGTSRNEIEPNNSISTANAIATPGTVAAAIGFRSDIDLFSVQLPAGRTLNATMTPNPGGDYDLYVYNSIGQLVGFSENGTGTVEKVAAYNGSNKTVKHYVRVIYYSGGTGATNGRYTLNLQW